MKKEKFNIAYPITDRMVMFTNDAPLLLRGLKIPILKNNGVRFDDKLDLKTYEIIRTTNPKYARNISPTINKLIERGLMVEWKPYVEINFYDVLANPILTKNGEPDFKLIQRECREKKGLKVSIKALTYVYDAWKMGFKVGYVDIPNKVHIFCPSGQLNPLSYHITELHETAKDWQIDYLC